MEKEIWRVGVYIEEDFVEFATCTTNEKAERAKELLEKAGWTEDGAGEVDIKKSNLELDRIVIDDVVYDL